MCSRLSDSLIDTLEMCSCNLVCRLFFFFFPEGERKREKLFADRTGKRLKAMEKKIKNKKVSKKKKNYLIYTSRRREKDPF